MTRSSGVPVCPRGVAVAQCVLVRTRCVRVRESDGGRDGTHGHVDTSTNTTAPKARASFDGLTSSVLHLVTEIREERGEG